MTAISIVFRGKKGTRSYRTNIPQELAQYLELDEKDIIEWTRHTHYGERAVLLKKVRAPAAQAGRNEFPDMLAWYAMLDNMVLEEEQARLENEAILEGRRSDYHAIELRNRPDCAVFRCLGEQSNGIPAGYVEDYISKKPVKTTPEEIEAVQVFSRMAARPVE